MKEWVLLNGDKKTAHQLAQECGIDEFTAYLLCANGICDPFEIDEFLSEEVSLQDPYMLADMENAASRILSAIQDGEKIAIFGDYDCDGVTSTVLLNSVLKRLGADCIWRVPTRDEGYGMSVDAVDELNEKGVKLIVTVDNGVTAFKAIERANELDIDVVVTDHHLPADTLPNAYAIVDPKRDDCPSEFKDYAGVGVAFMLCLALCDIEPEELLYTYGDLVAVGTIADVMPLKSDNRMIVKQGIKCLKRGTSVGFSALLEASGVAPEKLTSSSVAYTIAPRINATGRVFHPEKAINLLLCEDKQKAIEEANELCELNTKRREQTDQIMSEALEMILSDEKAQNSPVIVVGGENWHHGVIGIAASKLCSIFSRPAVVFSLDETHAVGSARSYKGASIYDILSSVKDLAENFGGHSSAAGITIKRENFQKVKTAIQNSARNIYGTLSFDKLQISCKLNPAKLDIKNAYAQMNLEPFGAGNERPNFIIERMIIVNIIPLTAGKHLKLILSRSGGFDDTVEVMAFFTTMEEFLYKKGDKIDVVVSIDVNVYNGNEHLSVVLKDIRKSEFEQEKLLKDIRVYQNFRFFGEYESLPKITRDDVVEIYKKIRMFKKIQADEAEILFVFQNDDFLKLRIILDILKELEFIALSYDGKFKIEYIENAPHRDLDESKMYNLVK